MKNLDIEQLKTYIEEEKWGHMKLLLSEYLEQPLSDADKGACAAKIGAMFLEVQASQLEKTNGELQDTLNMLRAINAAERESIAKIA